MVKSFLLFSMIVVWPCILHSQTFLDTLSSCLNNYLHYFPQEKIYIHFDKPIYHSGENAWFKSYITSNGNESGLSKIAYFELIDSNGTILKRLTLPVLNSSASGNFTIPENNHILYVRAYTAWMLNFGKENLYYRKIIIENTNNYTKDKVQNFYTSFFPEGGSIIQGLKNKIVCRTFCKDEFPIKATGEIIDASGNILTNVKTNDNGFGEFMFTPTDTGRYKAVMMLENGFKKIFELPEASNEGIVFYLKNDFNPNGNQLSFQISRNSINKNDYQNLVVCSQLNDHVQFNEVDFNQNFSDTNNHAVVTSIIPLNLFNFPSGILHLSVFNLKTRKLLAERFTNYNSGDEMMDASIIIDTLNFSPHGSNTFTLKLSQSIKENLSVSVTSLYDSDKLNTNFSSSNFITNNFNNYVNNPAWCSDSDIETQQALDDFLITKKNQDFSWPKILKDSFPNIIYKPEKSLSFSGKVFVTKNNKSYAFSNKNFFLAMKTSEDSNLSVFKIKTDTAGRFNLSNLNFNDTALFYLQTYNTGDKLTLAGDKYFTDSIYTTDFYDGETFNNNDTFSTIATSKIIHPHFSIKDTSGTTLKPVIVQTKVISHTDSTIAHFCYGPFNTFSRRDFDFTNDSTHLFDFENVYQFIETHFIRERAAYYYLNEQLIEDNEYQILSNIYMRDVALVRVFGPGFPYAPQNAPNGVIAVYLKDGTEKKYNSFFTRFLKKGYTPVDSFSIFKNLRDNQNTQTIYWNPNLMEDSLTHSYKINFYNPGNSNSFNITVGGIDEKGNLMYKEIIIKKEK